MADDLRHFLDQAAQQAFRGTGACPAPPVPGPEPASTQDPAAAPTPVPPSSDRRARPDRSERTAVLRRRRRRLLPRTVARPPRPGRTARRNPLLEAPHRGDRRRPDLRRGADLRAVRLRQVVARQGGVASPSGRPRAGRLRRGDRGRHGSTAPARAAQTLSRPAGGTWGWRKRWPPFVGDRASPTATRCSIVLDQFEQWLHAQRGEENTELVQAVRQCDGERVQCLLMVRDDFWMAASRFMEELEIRIVQGENAAAVDLFDLRHAGRSWRRSAGLSGGCRKARASWARSTKPSLTRRLPACLRTARSSPSAWPCSPRWSRASPGRRRR